MDSQSHANPQSLNDTINKTHTNMAYLARHKQKENLAKTDHGMKGFDTLEHVAIHHDINLTTIASRYEAGARGGGLLTREVVKVCGHSFMEWAAMFRKDGYYISVQGLRTMYRFHTGDLDDRRPLQILTPADFLRRIVKVNLSEKSCHYLELYLRSIGEPETELSFKPTSLEA